MENKNENLSFSFVYSADEQEEIRQIRQKYLNQEEDRMSIIRKLDNSVTQKATTLSLIIGVIGALIMGSGMSLFMTDLGSQIGVGNVLGLILGVVLGIIGMIFVALAYPVYCKVLKTEREKVAPQILKLSEELLK